jgi:multidrug efflux pump subunit AcrA (membrane-fusion protein)
VTGLVAPPIFVGMQISKVIRADESGMVARRVVLSLGIVLAALALVSLVPIPVSVKCACVVEPSKEARVTAPFSGFLRSVLVKDGDRVRAGESLGRIENPEIGMSLADMTLRMEEARVYEAAALAAQNDRTIPALRALAGQFEIAVSKYRADLEAAALPAPESGIVVGNDLRFRAGTFLQRGELFCKILPDGPMLATVALSESQTALVRPGQTATFRLGSLPGEKFHGRVLSVAPSPAVEFPHQSLGQHAGGTVPAKAAAMGARGEVAVAVPAGQVYKARVAIDNPGGLLRPGMSGRIRISCGTKPLGPAVLHSLSNLIRTDFQL